MLNPYSLNVQPLFMMPCFRWLKEDITALSFHSPAFYMLSVWFALSCICHKLRQMHRSILSVFKPPSPLSTFNFGCHVVCLLATMGALSLECVYLSLSLTVFLLSFHAFFYLALFVLCGILFTWLFAV